MVGKKKRVTYWLAALAVLAMAEIAAAVTFGVALTQSAQAQWFGGDDRFTPRRYRSGGGGGFFGDWFGSPQRRGPAEGGETYQQAPADNSRAPAPRKPTPGVEQVAPTTSIVVMGDGMADWLAYGLEDAFADAPEVAIVRKAKQHSGLLRYEPKGDLDWWHVARDILAQEKANYVVMMLGVGDRQLIRERDLAKEAEKKEKEKEKKAAEKKPADKPAANNPEANKDQPVESKEAAADKDEGVEQSIVAPEPTTSKRANGIIEFRTEKWAEIYAKRIDETIAALKSKGVPVFWVGLPSIRGPKSTADAVYLNDLYRARAERAGAVYIDVWDGFVDEGGKFTTFGPDYEGQVRRLRSNDGVYFTKYGARKLAHYVEREIRRYMSNRSLQVSLPTGPLTPTPESKSPRERPLAGPVVPLTVTPAGSEELAGGQVSHPDALASRVLVKGEPVYAPAGRADDFYWPRGSDAPRPAPPPTAAVPAAPGAAAVATAPAAGPSGYVEPPAPAEKKEPPKTAQAAPKPKPPPRTTSNGPPRPPAPIRQSNPFGWFR